jgi:hypothetical protein
MARNRRVLRMVGIEIGGERGVAELPRPYPRGERERTADRGENADALAERGDAEDRDVERRRAEQLAVE